MGSRNPGGRTVSVLFAPCALQEDGSVNDIPANAYPYAVSIGADDVDIQGRVSNHDIVRILADAAAAHSSHLGWDLAAYRRLGAWWVVRRHEVDYLQAAKAGDDLVCHTWPASFEKLRAARRHVLVRPTDGAVVARALNVWTLIDIKTGRPRRFPADILEAFDPTKWVGSPDGA